MSFNPTITQNQDGTRNVYYRGRTIKIFDPSTEINESLFKVAIKDWDKPENITARAEETSGSSMNGGRSEFMKQRNMEVQEIREANIQGRKEYLNQIEEELKEEGISMNSNRSEYMRRMGQARKEFSGIPFNRVHWAHQ